MNIDLSQLEFIDKKLRDMAIETEENFGVDFVITSLFRIGDNGVHGTLPLRGLDWRCRDILFGKLVEDQINKHWKYDPTRPDMKCCMCHDVGGGIHLHLQVHANTVRI